MSGPRRKSVLHVIPTVQEGGAETQLRQLIASRASYDEKHSVMLLKPGTSGMQVLGGELRFVGENLSLQDIIRWLVHELVLLRREPPDVLHSWMYHAGAVGLALHAILPRRRKRRVLVHLHHVWAWNMDLPASRVLAALGIWVLSRVLPGVVLVACNDVVGRSNSWMGPDSVRIVPNTVSESFFHAGDRRKARLRAHSREERIRVVFVGRDHPDKAPGRAVAALRAVVEQCPGVEALMVGRGFEPGSERMRECVGDPSLVSDRLRFLGPRNDVVSILESSTILFLPSRAEALPVVLLEGMAMGLDVVATDLPGVRSVVGREAWLVPQDAPVSRFVACLCMAIDRQTTGGVRFNEVLNMRAKERYSVHAASNELSDLYTGPTR